MEKVKNTNCKAVVESVQKYLLLWAGEEKADYETFANDSDESAFVGIVNEYIKSYGKEQTPYGCTWSTPAGVLRHFAEGGMLDISYFDVNNRLKSWGLNPERYTDEKNWETYVHLICRDGERLYNTKGMQR